MDVSWINKKVISDDEKVNQKLKNVLNLIDVTVQTVRKLASELRPSMLDDLGLTAAIEWQCEEFRKHSGIDISFVATNEEIDIPGNTSIGLFRILQESLTNIARHAGAKTVAVGLQINTDRVVLAITDDGKGFELSDIGNKKTLGLLGMKERAMMMEGKYEIKSKPGKGTTVMVSILLNDQNKDKQLTEVKI